MTERHAHDGADRDQRLRQRVVERPAQPSVVVERLDPGDHADDAISLTRREPRPARRQPELMRPSPTRASSSPTSTRRSTPGATETRRTLATTAAATAAGPHRLRRPPLHDELLEQSSFRDAFDDYLGFLEPRLREVRRLLHPTGTLYFHIDWREAHYCKLLLDELFGRECFLNELISAYDYAPSRAAAGRRSTTRSSSTSSTRRLLFDARRRPRAVHGARLVTPEKAERGKRPTDVIWHTIVSPTGREKTGYPTQKPEGLLRRFVQASSRPTTSAWTRSRAPERWARSRPASAGATC